MQSCGPLATPIAFCSRRRKTFPGELFADFARDPRVKIDPTPDEMVNSPAGVTEAFAGVARTGSVCVDVGFQKTGMASLLAPLHIVVVAAETIVPQPRDLFRDDVLGGKGLGSQFRFHHRPQRHRRHGPAGPRSARPAPVAHH